MKQIMIKIRPKVDEYLVLYQSIYKARYGKHISKARALGIMIQHGIDGFLNDIKIMNKNN